MRQLLKAIVKDKIFNMIPFSALTPLIGRQEGYLACIHLTPPEISLKIGPQLFELFCQQTDKERESENITTVNLG